MSFTEDDYDIGQSFRSNYEKTKFIAEGIIRKAMKNGMNAKIYRVGHIANNSHHTRKEYINSSNRIFQVIKGMINSRKIPFYYQEKISFSYVDIISKMMLMVISENIQTDQYCFHIENPNYISFIGISKIISSFGEKISLVDYDDFMSNMSLPYSDNEDVILYRNWIERCIKNPTNAALNSNKTLDLFSSNGIVFPSRRDHYLKNIVSIIKEMDENLNLI
mgnify:CR=1 FL=1